MIEQFQRCILLSSGFSKRGFRVAGKILGCEIAHILLRVPVIGLFEVSQALAFEGGVHQFIGSVCQPETTALPIIVGHAWSDARYRSIKRQAA